MWLISRAFKMECIKKSNSFIDVIVVINSNISERDAAKQAIGLLENVS